MREIKFRAWDKEQKVMYEVKKVDFSEQKVFCKQYYLNDWKFSEIELMQYTGLKDKNNKEIFEDDIVKIEDYYENVRIGIIAFDSGTYKLQNLGQNFYYQFGSDGEYDWESIENVDEDNIEILGNIYENPELLDK